DEAFGGYRATARPEGGNTTEAAGRQGRKERAVDAVPGRDEDREEAAAEKRAKPLPAAYELFEDHGLRPVRAQLGRLFAPARGCVIHMSETVLNHRGGCSGKGLTEAIRDTRRNHGERHGAIAAPCHIEKALE